MCKEICLKERLKNGLKPCIGVITDWALSSCLRAPSMPQRAALGHHTGLGVSPWLYPCLLWEEGPEQGPTWALEVGFGALAAGNSEVVCVCGLWLEGGVLAVSVISLWSQGPLPLGDGCGKKGPELGPRAESQQSETKDGVGNGLLKPHLILLTSTEI